MTHVDKPFGELGINFPIPINLQFSHSVACKKVYFCCSSNHMSYAQHNCASAYKKDVQVPVCPLCNKPVPVERGALPDIAVGNHIDNYCQSDRAQERKKVNKSAITSEYD